MWRCHEHRNTNNHTSISTWHVVGKKGIFRGNLCVEQSEDGVVEIIQNLIDFALTSGRVILTQEQKGELLMQDNYDQYRGMRALLLTRVSTPIQEKKYSHAAQERVVREKLIDPLELRIMDEERHIIHDTYTGLEYRYRQALEDILEMAERGEFDLLCMDVLDRGLGRKALAREMFRMQLRELGVRIGLHPFYQTTGQVKSPEKMCLL
jgi:hypothetical protein